VFLALRLKSKDAPTPAPAAVPAIHRLVGHGNDEMSEGGTPAVVTIPDWAPLRAPKARQRVGGRVGSLGAVKSWPLRREGKVLEGWKIDDG
jgi:hypothetical protein